MAFYCLLLPKTPPQKGKIAFAAAEAMQEMAKPRLLMLCLISFPIACIHQFYFVHTAGMLASLNIKVDLINKIFGSGGGGLMTIGQMSELIVLSLIPFFAKLVSRKTILTVGLIAYALRFFVFAYMRSAIFVIPALALHGVCFGCFFFICFMIVDEETTKDVRASTQGLYNLIIIGFGTIFGNLFAGMIGAKAIQAGSAAVNYQLLFSIPMLIAAVCAVALVLFLPGGKKEAIAA